MVASRFGLVGGTRSTAGAPIDVCATGLAAAPENNLYRCPGCLAPICQPGLTNVPLRNLGNHAVDDPNGRLIADVRIGFMMHHA